MVEIARNARHTAVFNAEDVDFIAERVKFFDEVIQPEVHRNGLQVGFFQQFRKGADVQTGKPGGFHTGVAACAQVGKRAAKL